MLLPYQGPFFDRFSVQEGSNGGVAVSHYIQPAGVIYPMMSTVPGSSYTHYLLKQPYMRTDLFVDRTLMMANCPCELLRMRDLAEDATGRVFVAGLGLGVVVEILEGKLDVEAVEVVELSPIIINLLRPYTKKWYKTTVTWGNVLEEVPDGFDYYIFDIWSGTGVNDLRESAEFKARFGERCSVWSLA